MITGDCPYDCGEIVINYMPEVTPKFGKCTCTGCGKEYWMHYSRIQPEAYTVEDFNEKYIVDEETKSIKERNPLPPPTPLQQEILDRLAEHFAQEIEDTIMGGPSDAPN